VEKKEEIRVNFIDNTYTVITTVKRELFHNDVFHVEGDRNGYSCIEKWLGDLYARNYLKYVGDKEYTIINEEKINHDEARSRIKEIIQQRREGIY
jgi:hypothetical protein